MVNGGLLVFPGPWVLAWVRLADPKPSRGTKAKLASESTTSQGVHQQPDSLPIPPQGLGFYVYLFMGTMRG